MFQLRSFVSLLGILAIVGCSSVPLPGVVSNIVPLSNQQKLQQNKWRNSLGDIIEFRPEGVLRSPTQIWFSDNIPYRFVSDNSLKIMVTPRLEVDYQFSFSGGTLNFRDVKYGITVPFDPIR